MYIKMAMILEPNIVQSDRRSIPAVQSTSASVAESAEEAPVPSIPVADVLRRLLNATDGLQPCTVDVAFVD
jgi:hypothetical protein